MFPPAENRIGTFLRRSVDAAIDFATLGEYGLSSAMDERPARLAPLPPRADVLTVALAPPPVPAAAALAPADLREAFRLQAASAAARKLTAAAHVASPAAAPAAQHPHRRRGAAAPAAQHKSRKRAGSATRTEQLCFFID
jgi:hypothetical protein